MCRATGELGSAKEALIKWSRGLQATPWRAEPAAFDAYATAALHLAAVFADAADAGEGSVR